MPPSETTESSHFDSSNFYKRCLKQITRSAQLPSTPPAPKYTAPLDPHWRQIVGRRADGVYSWCPMAQSVLQDRMPYKKFICLSRFFIATTCIDSKFATSGWWSGFPTGRGAVDAVCCTPKYSHCSRKHSKWFVEPLCQGCCGCHLWHSCSDPDAFIVYLLPWNSEIPLRFDWKSTERNFSHLLNLPLPSSYSVFRIGSRKISTPWSSHV